MYLLLHGDRLVQRLGSGHRPSDFASLDAGDTRKMSQAQYRAFIQAQMGTKEPTWH